MSDGVVVADVVGDAGDGRVRELVGLEQVARAAARPDPCRARRRPCRGCARPAPPPRDAPRRGTRPCGVVLVSDDVHVEADLAGSGTRPATSCASEPIASVPPKPPYAPASPITRHRMPDDRAVALEPELDVLHLRRGRASSRRCSRSGTRPSAPAGSSSRATRTATMPSGAQCLAPNEPPTCGAITRSSSMLDAEDAGGDHRGSCAASGTRGAW